LPALQKASQREALVVGHRAAPARRPAQRAHTNWPHDLAVRVARIAVLGGAGCIRRPQAHRRPARRNRAPTPRKLRRAPSL